MINIKGNCNNAICHISKIEQQAIEQIKTLCDTPEFSDCKIRIMPDVHAGKSCTIGTTMTITDKIVPSIVGVDIGCGMQTAKLTETNVDLKKLDECIQKQIPAGFNIRTQRHDFAKQTNLNLLRCVKHVDIKRAEHSIGTLGGGNHFIEVNKNESGELFLVIHSGSRHLGCEVAKYYQNAGYEKLCGINKQQIEDKIAQLKAEGRHNEIQKTIKKLKEDAQCPVPKELAYVTNSLFDDYVHDMQIVQNFASLNRKAMMDEILNVMQLNTPKETFETVHNYIDTKSMILRKGAVSAKANERLLIPINMRDGSLICIGKGNADWNYSAPHGAGRIMSRKQANKELSMTQYESEMTHVYSTCVQQSTLDESPMAYKPMHEIIEQLEPTATIIDKITPIYNFKSTK